MISYRELESMTIDELKALSVKKNKRGSYTFDANLAYQELRRRSGRLSFEGIPRRCSIYTAEADYSGEIYPD